MNLIGKTTIHPVFFYSGKISGYLTWVAMLLLSMNIDIVDRKSLEYNTIISIVILLIGLVFVVWSMINLGKSTRLGLPSEKTVFKTHGLYAISRNPMYIGFNLLTISSMIYSLNILIMLIGIYSIIIYHFIILGEKRFMENRFGKDYLEYKKKRRRYL
jgi:protein-S-isoprenylcysteine O-methyltransferase Ste14